MLIELYIEEAAILFCRLFPELSEVNSICCEQHYAVQNQTGPRHILKERTLL
jgi:hypothetical protein